MGLDDATRGCISRYALPLSSNININSIDLAKRICAHSEQNVFAHRLSFSAIWRFLCVCVCMCDKISGEWCGECEEKEAYVNDKHPR